MEQTDSELSRELRIHQGVEVVASLPGVVLAYTFAPLVMVVHSGIGVLLTWKVGVPLLLLTAFSIVGLLNWAKLRGLPRPEFVSKRRIRNLTIASAIQGSLFALFLLGLAVDTDHSGRLYVLTLAIISILGTVGIYSTSVALAFAIPSILCAATWIIATGTLSPATGLITFATVSITVSQFVLRTRRATLASLEHVLESRKALSEQLNAEERLRAAEADAARKERERQNEAVKLQRDIINAIAFPMVISDGNEALEVTPAGRVVFKVPEGPLDGVLLSKFFADPKDQFALAAEVEAGRSVDNYEVVMKDTEGTAFWCAVSMRPLVYKGRACWLNSIYVIDARKRMEQDLARAKDEAEKTLVQLKTAQESLVHAEKMASLGELTAGIAHEIKNPLNFVNNFAKLSADMMEELAEIVQDPIQSLDEDAREDAEDILTTVKSNLLKIDEHGKRADSIVKNMLLHSRQGRTEMDSAELDPLVEESVNLAYHGARAADPAFNIEIKTDFGAKDVSIRCLPQELQRVILNLCSNAMYAAVRETTHPEGQGPVMSVATWTNEDRAFVMVTDNGGGIPKDVQTKIFEPFYTTKPTGEGTGLGLSMSFDIIKQHGGTLSVESEVGVGTSFTVELPLVTKG
ncbi:ATP-binding protein [Rhodobacteraceae bacterium D3-12]|nr:ATP-binding protein [Rhodobacteraceae bacterium D3-12]